MPTEFFVNVDSILAGAERIGTIPTRLAPIIENEMRILSRELLIQTFQEGMEVANSDDGFPEEFQEALMESVHQMPITCFMDGGSVFISVDFDDLGNREDLEKAYHQGATLEGGGKLWGPYTGQPLKQEDEGIRHIFWEALRRGDSSVQVGDKNVHIREGSWEETKAQYLSIWGEKAPQWLFIQFGQEEWDPYIPQYDLIGEFERSLRYMATEVLARLVAAEVAIANNYASKGLEVGYQGANKPVRVQSGTITVNGKTYSPGRFAPRAGV